MKIRTHPFVVSSFEYLRKNAARIPVTVYNDIQNELETSKTYKLNNPHFLELKDRLWEVSSEKQVSREDNKEISIVVLDMYRLFTESNGNI